MDHSASSIKQHAVDMTEGPIWRLLVLFALPLLLGNLFQQLYNTVDSIILGNVVSKQALAAVGSTTSLCNTLLNFFNGVSIGSGVIISHCFGAKDEEGLHSAVETTIMASLGIGLVVSVAAVPFVPVMLDLVSTPADVLGPATTYLRIYFMGVIFLFTYNMGGCILRAVGDTKRPLLFLIFSSVLNIVLDLLFVVVFRWGIAGAAIATILSEAISAALVCMTLMRSREAYRLTLQDLHINWSVLRRILVIGVPVGIQQSLTAFSNAFVQSYINRFDSSSIVAGWSTHMKVDQFTILPAQSIGQAATTFVSQNLGAGREDRARKGFWTSLVMGIGVLLAISAAIYISAERVAFLFNREPDVVYFGAMFMTMMLPYRPLSAIFQCVAGALRGEGDAQGPMIIMLFSLVLVRWVYLLTVTRFPHDVYTVAFAYPVGWIACSALSALYYCYRSRRR